METPPKLNIFISYRKLSDDSGGRNFLNHKKELGWAVANNLNAWICGQIQENVFPRDTEVFFDRKGLKDGNYYSQICKRLDQATHVFLIVPPGALNRCYAPDEEIKDDPKDVFGYEIRNALANPDCTILPIFINAEGFFSDKGKPITSYDEFPPKFRILARERRLKQHQSYYVKIKGDHLDSEQSEKLEEKWNSYFAMGNKKLMPKARASEAERKRLNDLLEKCRQDEAETYKKEEKVPTKTHGKSVFSWILPALILLAAGIFAYFYNENAKSSVPAIPPSKTNETLKQTKENSREELKENLPEKSEPLKAEEAENEKIKQATADLQIALDQAAREAAKEKPDDEIFMKALDSFENYVNQGARANLVSAYDKQTPLHLAADTLRISLSRKLLAQGANPNARDSWSWTPLHNVARRNNPEIIRLLLEKGADKTLKNNNGETAYDIALKHNASEEILRTLK